MISRNRSRPQWESGACSSRIFSSRVTIYETLILDIHLSADTKRNLQSAAIQKRVSEANIISAKADVEAAKMLKETSEILNSQSAMQIRYLEAVQNIISSGNQKTMFVSLKGKE